MKTLLLAALTIAITSCAIRKDLETPFATPDNKPIVKDPGGTGSGGTKDCMASATGKFDFAAITMQTGQNGDGSAWAEGGGCINRPIRETWAAMSNQGAMKWNAADSSTYTRQINPTSDFTHLYAVTYNKSTLIGEISWTIDWYEGPDQGTFLEPERINIIYGRTSGTSNIPIWNGGVTLTKISDTVTSIEIHNNFKARQSASDNIGSTQDCLNEIVTHARTASPDWTTLNTGLKPNPSQADAPTPNDPNAGASVCVKDSTGHYSAAPITDANSDQGVSIVTTRQCAPTAAAALYAIIKNPISVLWQNAASGNATASPTTADTQVVAYAGSHGFFHSALAWTQDWTYTATPATSTTPENYLVRYNMDPATADFPVWQGSVAIIAVDASTSAVVIQNHLLLDSVSGSPAQNTTLTQGLLSALTAAPAPATN